MAHATATILLSRIAGLSDADRQRFESRINLNPAAAAGRIADLPTAQPLAKTALLTRKVSCAAVGNCRQQRLYLAEYG
jgi:hypothetical protein